VAALAAVAFSASAQARFNSGFYATEDPVVKKGVIVLAHGLHTSCMNGPTQPNDQGPNSYHTTPEAGVHIKCSPPEGPKDPELKQEQRQRNGDTKRQ
jgi:hypothetical protein